MQVLNLNNVKVYDLSCGKSVPDWIAERKRRLLQKKDGDIRRRIELIQDFNMPGVSTGVKLSKDGQFVLATGVYKPRIRCYDVNNLSMKFERCFDAEAVQFEILSDDYSKIVLLQCDRTVEFHSQQGYYYRTRIPKFGRDMAYQMSTCDLYLVGASSEIYRLNLEQGKFLNSLQTNASSINRICINPVHDFVVCGTVEGRIEAWDHRTRNCVGTLDCALSCVTADTEVSGFPSITSVQFKDGLTMSVGTATGQILLYDIRSNKPFVVKDHMYGLPIKNIEFIKSEDLVASMDIKCVKLWHMNTGKPYTAITPATDLNDMCIVPNTGLMFLANEEKKILTYYIPSIGPAPKWCYFLDNLTEELEETQANNVYDDYKFVTTKELEDLGLGHLIGSSLLRAYMHGFFMDIRLYNKARAIVQPFAYREFQKKKIKEKIDSERKNRVLKKDIPTVNRTLAQKIMEISMEETSNKQVPTLLNDERFKAMFVDPEYTIDETADEFSSIKPLFSKLDKMSHKKNIQTVAYEQFDTVQEEEEGKNAAADFTSSDESEELEESEGSEQIDNDYNDNELHDRVSCSTAKKPKLFEIKDAERFKMFRKRGEAAEDTSLTIEERLKKMKNSALKHEYKPFVPNKTITFTIQKSASQKKREQENKEHEKERALYRRPARNLRKRHP